MSSRFFPENTQCGLRGCLTLFRVSLRKGPRIATDMVIWLAKKHIVLCIYQDRSECVVGISVIIFHLPSACRVYEGPHDLHQIIQFISKLVFDSNQEVGR